VALARKRGLIAAKSRTAAMDSTGLETRHVSTHYARRSWRHSGHYKRRYPKLSALGDTSSHVLLSAVVDRGPKPDIMESWRLIEQALRDQRMGILLADAGYESEALHVWCRKTLKVRSIVPTTHRGRRRKDGGTSAIGGFYRRRLHDRFPKKTYGQRWQIETAFSMLKRNLGSALRSRRPFALNREALLRVIVHNIMILLCRIKCFQQSKTNPK